MCSATCINLFSDVINVIDTFNLDNLILLLCASLISRSRSHTLFFEWNNPTPVRKRFSLTNAGLGKKHYLENNSLFCHFFQMSYQQSSSPYDVRV